MNIIRHDWKERLKASFTSPKRWAIRIVIILIAGVFGYMHYTAEHPSAAQAAQDAQDGQSVVDALADPSTAAAPAASVATAQPAQGVIPVSAGDSGVVHPMEDTAPAKPTLSLSTYGNQVASFFPGEAPKDAVRDALGKVNSMLDVNAVTISGYPDYALECEKNNQCVNNGGMNLGSVSDVASQMFPVNPADINRDNLSCNIICYDDKGSVIGRDPSFRTK